jgi:uncharacterized protein YndB with AHSA1/START domain
MNGDVIPPLVKTVEVEIEPMQAFQLFTTGMGTWWPLGTHSIAADTHEGRVQAKDVVFEPRPGGRIFEVMSDGQEGEWGTVRTWEPPHRVIFSWKPNLTDGPFTEIEVRFEPTRGGTRVRLEHRGWEHFGDQALGRRALYDSGWSALFEMYRTTAKAG